MGTETSYPHLKPWKNLLPKAGAQEAHIWEDETERRELKRIEERERRREKDKKKREEERRSGEENTTPSQMYFVSFGCIFPAAFCVLKFSRISLCLRNNADGLAWQI